VVSHVRSEAAVIASLCIATAVACGSPASSPVAPQSETAATTISGSERLAWRQVADSLDEANAYSYGMYVDGNRVLLSSTICTAGTTAGRYDCSAGLPKLAAGQHVLELVAIDTGGNEGPRSARLVVTVSNP
jgi:hypothetical protein